MSACKYLPKEQAPPTAVRSAVGGRGLSAAALLVALLLVVLLVTGCGRRGALEPPPGSAAAIAAESGQTAPTPDRSFILDPLI